jgi:hypothetical protein
VLLFNVYIIPAIIILQIHGLILQQEAGFGLLIRKISFTLEVFLYSFPFEFF